MLALDFMHTRHLFDDRPVAKNCKALALGPSLSRLATCSSAQLPALRRYSPSAGQRYWLVLKRDDPDLCYIDPGFGDDVVIRTDLEAITRVYLGQLRLADARSAGVLEIEGPRGLTEGVNGWFPVSGFASHAHPVRYDPSSKSFRRIDKVKVPVRLATN